MFSRCRLSTAEPMISLPKSAEIARAEGVLANVSLPVRVGPPGAPGVFAADAADPVVAGKLIAEHRPYVLALVAGAAPLLRQIHLHTWETFSTNWQSDVRITFHWLREALLLPLQLGSRVIVMSSGAVLMGSPLSGGYAGAKATQRHRTLCSTSTQ